MIRSINLDQLKSAIIFSHRAFTAKALGFGWSVRQVVDATDFFERDYRKDWLETPIPMIKGCNY